MKEISGYSRPRPVIELSGTPFYVDAQWLYLIEVGNADNRIDTGEARCYNDHIELWYDPNIKNVYQGSYEKSPPEHIHNYWFHSFDALDPTGAAARLDELNPEWRSAFRSGLPVIDIAGRKFYVDKKDSCFYEVNNCWNWIRFKDINCRKKKRGLLINLAVHNIAFLHEVDAVHHWVKLHNDIVFVPVIQGKRVKKIINRYFLQHKIPPSPSIKMPVRMRRMPFVIG
jgi:hypothetical protein